MNKEKNVMDMTEEEIKAVGREIREEVEKEFALKPYTDNLPYSEERLIQEIEWLLRHEMQAKFEIGRRLIFIREKTDCKRLQKIIAEHFPGLGERTAYNYMTFAKKATELPHIKTFAEENWSKALMLVNAFTEEELKEVELKGLKGKTLNDLDGMSAREMYKLIKRLKSDRKAIEDEKVRILKLELKHTKQDLDYHKSLAEGIPATNEALCSKLSEIEDYTNKVVGHIRRLAFNKDIVGDFESRRQLEAKIRAIWEITNNLYKEWGVFIDEEGLDYEE